MNIFPSMQVFKLVVAAVQESKAIVPFNKTWQYLHAELGIGSVINKTLTLTASDRQYLVQLLAKETGADLKTVDLAGLSELSRTDITNTVINEKWSQRKVREDIIYLKSLDDEVMLEKTHPTPKGGYLGVPWQQAVNHQHQVIIAIENLEVFLNADIVKWPLEVFLSTPLFVYRGDAEATPSAFKKFIESTTQKYYVFFDYDPAGFMMALTQPRLPSVIIPDVSTQVLKKCTKKAAYDKQYKAVDYLKKTTSKAHNHIEIITSHQLAVMQEKMLSSQMSLRVINI